MTETKPEGEYTQLDIIRQEENAFKKFAALRLANDDAVSIPKIYFDIVGDDFAAAAVLDEILFWTLPNKKTGRTALRVRKDGILWLAVSRSEWWDRKRLTERQADRGIEKLVELGLIEKCIHRFNGHGQMHLRVIGKEFFVRYGTALQQNYLNGSEEDPEPMQELKDLYEMMGMSDSPNGDSPNGDTDSPNGDTDSRIRNTLNSLQPASNQPPKVNNNNSDFLQTICRLYEGEIGIITPMIADAIRDAEKNYPVGWVEDAIQAASRRQVRNWAYIEAILKRWKIDGKNAPFQPAANYKGNGKQKTGKTFWEQLEAA